MAEEQALKSLVCDREELRRIRSQEGPVGGAFCVRVCRAAVALANEEFVFGVLVRLGAHFLPRDTARCCQL
eukprot:7136955-Alexandrium_andersonii.AAC.1